MANSRTAIELNVNSIGQLFESFDPMPFRERDLDRNAEEYIVGWARELPRHAHIRIRVHLPAAEISHENGEVVRNAFARYFRYRADATGGALGELFRVGRYSLLVGLVLLAACSAAAELAGRLPGAAQFGAPAREGFIILGWVANWRPIEIFFYDWWPLLRRKRLFERLAQAHVELQPRAA